LVRIWSRPSFELAREAIRRDAPYAGVDLEDCSGQGLLVELLGGEPMLRARQIEPVEIPAAESRAGGVGDR